MVYCRSLNQVGISIFHKRSYTNPRHCKVRVTAGRNKPPFLLSLIPFLQFFSAIQGCKMPRGTDMAELSVECGVRAERGTKEGRKGQYQAVRQLNSRICGFLDDRTGAGCETATATPKRLRFYDYANDFIAFFLSTRARHRNSPRRARKLNSRRELYATSHVRRFEESIRHAGTSSASSIYVAEE